MGLDRSEAGAYVETNIMFTSTMIGVDKTVSYWPTKKSDCTIDFHSGRLNSCSMGFDGGAENVNSLCASVWDENYDLDIVITEIDSTSSNDVSSLHIPYWTIPDFTADGITRFTMKKVI